MRIPPLARDTAAVTLRAAAAVVLLVALLATGPGLYCVVYAFPSHPLALRAAARSLAPGEIVRIEVVAPAPLATLSGRFREREVFFTARDGGRTRWSGWAAIDLDAKAGPAAVTVSGITTEGDEAAGTLALRIVAKAFASEKLKVDEKYVAPPKEVEERIARERELTAAIYRTRRDVPPPSVPFATPVPGAPSSRFGTRRLYNGKPRPPHSGLDLRAATGTRVKSSGPGVVVLARDLYFSGGTVIVDHGGGLFTLYAHLSSIRAKEGAEIDAGDVVGLSGATGRVTGPHLHWGARIGDVVVDPRALLDRRLFD